MKYLSCQNWITMKGVLYRLVIFHVGIVIGWLFRWQRDKKMFDAIEDEAMKLKKYLDKL